MIMNSQTTSRPKHRNAFPNIGFGVCTCIWLFLGIGPSLAEHPVPTSPFEHLKNLTGRWEGMQQAMDGEKVITVVYAPTAKGSAVMERLFPDTPKEMVSIYTRSGPDIIMTHYCMLGNQPRMRSHHHSSPNKITLTYVDGTGMRSLNDMHMHELTITFVDDAHMTHEWTLFDKGRKKVTNTFTFTRK